MPSKYRIVNNEIPHFITFATVQWVDTLTRPKYKDIIIDSLKYCQKHKGLILYAYVIMTNHVHLIAAAQDHFKLTDIIRDLKKHTSKTILAEIDHPSESRQSWMLWIFKQTGTKNTNNKNYQFWQQDNRPIELSTNEMIDQRLEYLHMNPVKEGFVKDPENYVYSSAGNYCDEIGLIEIQRID